MLLVSGTRDGVVALLTGDETEDGLVLQAILVLFPTVILPLKSAVGERVPSQGVTTGRGQHLSPARSGNDVGSESPSQYGSRSVCVCCSTETETTLAVEVVVGWGGAAGDDNGTSDNEFAAERGMEIPLRTMEPFVFAIKD